jgi:hypothetical protein
MHAIEFGFQRRATIAAVSLLTRTAQSRQHAGRIDFQHAMARYFDEIQIAGLIEVDPEGAVEFRISRFAPFAPRAAGNEYDAIRGCGRSAEEKKEKQEAEGKPELCHLGRSIFCQDVLGWGELLCSVVSGGAIIATNKLLDTGNALSFNGKPKAPVWTASNNDDVWAWRAAIATLVDTGAFGLPLNEEARKPAAFRPVAG